MEKAAIKAWLKMNSHSHKWLADQIGCSLGGVNCWLSGPRPIPGRVNKMIALLMEQYPAGAEDMGSNTVTLTVNDATFDAWNSAAMAENKLLRQWCIDVITEHVNNLPNK